LKYSARLTAVIVEKSGFQDQLVIATSVQPLLSIFLIYLAVDSLLNVLPAIVAALWYEFKTKAGAGLFEDHEPTNWLVLILKIVLPLLLLVFCGQLSKYLSRNITAGTITVLEPNSDAAPQSDDAIEE